MPMFPFKICSVICFATSALQSASNLWRMRWTVLVRSHFIQAKGALQEAAVSRVDGMKWSQVSCSFQVINVLSSFFSFIREQILYQRTIKTNSDLFWDRQSNENTVVVWLLLHQQTFLQCIAFVFWPSIWSIWIMKQKICSSSQGKLSDPIMEYQW